MSACSRHRVQRAAQESKLWRRRNSKEKAHDMVYLGTVYWSRLASTAGCWFFWDFSFYGNRDFQSAFISSITGGSAPRWKPSCSPALLSQHLNGIVTSAAPANGCIAGSYHSTACIDASQQTLGSRTGPAPSHTVFTVYAAST